MAAHPFLTARFRTLAGNIFESLRGNPDAQERYFADLRWRRVGGSFDCPVCPKCGDISSAHRREKPACENHRGRWRCSSCRAHFSVISGSIFANCKLPLSLILKAIYYFVTTSKGRSAVDLSHHLNVSYKTAFVLLHKIRCAICMGYDFSPLEGEVEIDACWVFKYVRPEREHTKKGRKTSAGKTNPNKQAVLVLRLQGGRRKGAVRTLPIPIKAEDEATVLEIVRRFVRPGSVVYTDQAAAYTSLAAEYELRPVNHSVEYATEQGWNQNQAESYFNRFRSMMRGIYLKATPKYLLYYAMECAWREDNRHPVGGLQERLNVALRAIGLGQHAEPFVKYWGDKGRPESALTKLKRWIRRRPTKPQESWTAAQTDDGLQRALWP
ncbi:IS1595 family transposase [Cupriavidus sp. 8B]